jgi:hypothetical protein
MKEKEEFIVHFKFLFNEGLITYQEDKDKTCISSDFWTKQAEIVITERELRK